HGHRRSAVRRFAPCGAGAVGARHREEGDQAPAHAERQVARGHRRFGEVRRSHQPPSRAGASRAMRDRPFLSIGAEMKAIPLSVLFAAVAASAAFDPRGPTPQQGPPATPAEIVAAYNTLATSILSVKPPEHDPVMAMLAGTCRHAEAKVMQAVAKLGASQPAKDDVEAAAALVSQLGYEGDHSVAAIRKRLLDGGFHHNSAGEAQGIYEEGFVIVTKELKKTFLESATAIGKM